MLSLPFNYNVFINCVQVELNISVSFNKRKSFLLLFIITAALPRLRWHHRFIKSEKKTIRRKWKDQDGDHGGQKGTHFSDNDTFEAQIRTEERWGFSLVVGGSLDLKTSESVIFYGPQPTHWDTATLCTTFSNTRMNRNSSALWRVKIYSKILNYWFEILARTSEWLHHSGIQGKKRISDSWNATFSKTKKVNELTTGVSEIIWWRQQTEPHDGQTFSTARASLS